MVKLLPADFSQEAALEIMASNLLNIVDSQVAYKRFADTVPLAIDQRFIHAFDETISVTLVAGLSISSLDARERCAAWLAESQAVVRQRAELLDRKARLAEAKKELLEVPGVSAMRDTMAKATNRGRRERTRRSAASAKPASAPVTAATMSTSTPVAEEGPVLQEVESDDLLPMPADVYEPSAVVISEPFSRLSSQQDLTGSNGGGSTGRQRGVRSPGGHVRPGYEMKGRGADDGAEMAGFNLFAPISYYATVLHSPHEVARQNK
ncbi:hypothetical protein FRC10_005391 [Ceratobasidium sp. 414]|nr:hypothetical protein FRC10_005391 [Ceratobasidium sp. 414]